MSVKRFYVLTFSLPACPDNSIHYHGSHVPTSVRRPRPRHVPLLTSRTPLTSEATADFSDEPFAKLCVH